MTADGNILAALKQCNVFDKSDTVCPHETSFLYRI